MSRAQQSKLTDALQLKFQNKFSRLKLLIIDEVSMLGLTKFHLIHQILCCATQQTDSPLGGIHFLLCGDFYQLDPVMDTPLYLTGKNDIEQLSAKVYAQIDTFVELTDQMRQAGRDPEEDKFRSFLRNIRTGQATETDLAYARAHVKQSDFDCDSIKKEGSLCVTPFNGDTTNPDQSFGCANINLAKTERQMENGKKVHHVWAQHKIHAKKRLGKTERNRTLVSAMFKKPSKKDKFALDLTVFEGCRVMLRNNLSVSDGLVNGSIGTVHSLMWSKKQRKLAKTDITDMAQAAVTNSPPPIILVKFDSLPAHVKSFVADHENVIPIGPCSSAVGGLEGVSRIRPPLTVAECVTIHKSQGQSVDNVLIMLNKSNFYQFTTILSWLDSHSFDHSRDHSISRSHVMIVT